MNVFLHMSASNRINASILIVPLTNIVECAMLFDVETFTTNLHITASTRLMGREKERERLFLNKASPYVGDCINVNLF